MADDKRIIGRAEIIDIPDWDLYGIKAKIDTGAYTSSLHCHHIERVRENGKEYVRFNLLDPSHETYNEKLLKLPIFKSKKVKSSNGVSEERFIVKTKLRLLDKELEAELSLTDRSEMRYPVLIGRKLIKGHFIVDVSKKNLSNN